MTVESDGTVRINLLGGFSLVVDGEEMATDGLRRRALELIQLLALADRRRLSRDRVIEALWPHLEVDAGAANLRKAAHHIRQALGDRQAVVLKGGQVALLPNRAIETDVDEFEASAAEALESGDPARCEAAMLAYAELLPEALYESWTRERREHLRARHAELLRAAGAWERLVEAEPTAEAAYLQLMRRELEAGSRAAAIRWYGRLRTALQSELGLAPGADAVALYEECIAGLAGDEPEIVGRQLELATITAALREDVRIDLLAIRGSAGIGKSALCREVERLTSAEGWLVVSARATEAGGAYAPLIAAIEQLLDANPAIVDRLGEPVRSVLAELTPLAEPAPPMTSPISRHRVIGAFRRLVLNAAADAPALLVVDDAHLADEATIDVLGHLGASSGTRLVTVLAYRTEAAPPALARAVARLDRAERTASVDLVPLELDESRALIDVVASWPRDEDVAHRVIELGQGNPYLLVELARSAVAGVPALVRSASDAIAARFLDLDESTLESLQRVALAGPDIDPADVGLLTELDEDAAVVLLDTALHHGVLIVEGPRYRFRHELVRQALIERVAPHRRTAFHRQTAERLAAAGGRPGLVAARWLDGERPDAAAEWLLAAAREEIRLGAFADALRHLEPLLDHAPEHADGLRLRAEAMDARGESAAPAAYAAAARVADAATGHELQAKRALATVKLGDPAGGLEILDGVEPTTLDGRVAHALAHAGAAALGAADPAMGTAMAAQARQLAVEAGDPAAVTVASWAYAAAAHARGELRESVRADITESQGLGELAVNVFDGQLCMTQRLLYGARPYPDVIAFTESLAIKADSLGAARGKAFAVTIRGEAKLLSGDLNEADADLAKGAELHRAINAATGEAFALQRRAEVAMHRGDGQLADALLDEALAVARDSDVGFHLLDRIYGTRVTAAADPARAFAALEEAEAAVQGPIETCPTCRITLAIPAVIAAARAGELARADEWMGAADYLVNVVMRLPAWDAAFEEAKGHRALATGDAAVAREHFGAAATGFGRSGQPLDEARCIALAEGT